MKITLASVQYDTIEIDFQKVFDFMKNENKLKNTVYDYSTQFGDHIEYYLEQIYGIIISYRNIDDYDYDELHIKKIYPSSMNEYLFDSLYHEYYEWLNKNKEKLGLAKV